MNAALDTYGQRVRFDGFHPMSDDQIRRAAPSVFADSAHDSRSARYTYIPTVDVMNAMRSEGFFPVAAAQSRARDVTKREFTKHMLRFRRQPAKAYGVGEAVPEIVVVNSHDGSSSYALYSGLFRIACLNGMVTKMADVDDLKVTHSGKVVDRVVEGSYRVMSAAEYAAERARSWGQISLAEPEQLAFAKSAALLRYDGQTQPVSPTSLISVRRSEDRGSDLWTVFNRAQEGLLRGGQRYRSPSGRNIRTRPVGSIDKNVGLNQTLWQLGEEMAKIKTAA